MSEASMTEARRIEVDDVAYRLRPWGYQDGRRWLFRLLSTISGLQVGGGDAAQLGAILNHFGEKNFEELVEVCERYTDLVQRSEDGRESIVPLAKVAKVHMRRRYVDLFMILRGHLEMEFTDFLARLPELLAKGAARDS